MKPWILLFCLFLEVVSLKAQEGRHLLENPVENWGSFESCIEVICGPTSGVDSEFEFRDKSGQSKLPKELKQTLSTLYENARVKTNKNELNQIRLLRKMLGQNEISPKGRWQNLSKLNSVLLFFPEITIGGKEPGKVKISVNEKDSEAKLPDSLSSSQKKSLLSVQSEIFDSQEMQNLLLVQSMPTEMFIENLGAGTKGKDEVLVDLKTAVEDFENSKNHFTKEFRDQFSPKVEKIKETLSSGNQAGEGLREDQLVELLVASYTLRLSIRADKGDFKKLTQWDGLSTTDLEKIFGLEKSLEQLEKQLTDYSPKSIESLLEESMFLELFANRFVNLPKASESQNIQKKLSEVVGKTNSFVKMNFPLTSKIVSLDKLKVKNPPNQTHFAESMVKSLQSVITDEPEFHEKLPPKDLRDLAFITLLNFLVLEGQKISSDLDFILRDLNRPIVDDSYLPMGSGALNFSLYSLAYPEFGKGILLHEAGHAVWHRFFDSILPEGEAVKFQGILECLSRRHKPEDQKTFVLNIQGDKKVEFVLDRHVEEDWADLFSAKNLTQNDKNPACMFFEQENDSYKAGKLFDPADTGPHSQNLFRLLHIENAKSGSLPPECKNALKTNKFDVDFTPCI